MKEKQENDPKSTVEIQLEQFVRELDTEEGLKRLCDDAYKEALAAEKQPKSPTGSRKS